MTPETTIRFFKQVLATDSGMWGIWDINEYAHIMNYDDWEKFFLENVDMQEQIVRSKFIPITIHSDGVFEFETRVGTMGELAVLSEDEKKMVVVASEKYGLNASGKVGVSGIEHIDGKFQEESVCIIPLQGWYSAVVYLIDREKNPDAPDFIILLNQEAEYSHQFSTRLKTFEQKI
jgi:uncharacterized membrane protein